jgi:hypothetical protein
VLAGAILEAFGWDSDHLYEFAMTCDVRARCFVLPTPDEEIGPLDVGPTGASSVDLAVGALGLSKDHKFLFRYDFGDDLIIQAKFKPQRPGAKPPPDKIYIFEFQVQRDPKLHRTMILRTILAHTLHGRKVKTIVLALTPQAVVPTDHIYGEGPDGEDLRHRVTVRRVFEESADAALASDIAELLPLIPAMKPGDGDHAALLSRVVERILKWALSEEQRAMMLEQAANFATLHLPRHKVDGIVKDVTRRHRIMLDPPRDFPLVRDGYRKGKAEGMAKGEARGLAKGKAEGEVEGEARGLAKGKAESVLTILEARGVRMTKTLREKILSCTDTALLDRWLRSAASASCAADVLGAN